MKMRMAVVLAALTWMASTFSGCGLFAVQAKLDAVEDRVERRVEQVEAKAESAVRSAVQDAAEPKREATPDQIKLTAEKAQDIALEHAGFGASEVERLYAELERDDGIEYFEVQFRNGRTEYEYEVDAKTGSILSYDQDRD